MKKRARERAATTAAEAEVVVAAKEKVAATEPETEKVAVTEAAAATVEAEKDGATEAEAAKVDAEKAATDATRTGACNEPDHIILLAHFATISYTLPSSIYTQYIRQVYTIIRLTPLLQEFPNQSGGHGLG